VSKNLLIQDLGVGSENEDGLPLDKQ